MRALSPTVSSANSTGRPSSCASRSATGPEASTAGRARPWAGRGARRRSPARRGRAAWSAPAATRGSRPSSVTCAVLERDVQVGADEDAPALDPVLEQVVEGAHVGLERAADERGQVDQPVRVAPLVVVPADDLDLVADHLGQPGVEDARRRVGDDVGADDRVLGVGEDALERAVGRGLVGGLDLVDAGLACRR